MPKSKIVLLISTVATFVTACKEATRPSSGPYVVLECYLIANQPFQKVKLTRTTSYEELTNAPPSSGANAISGATVVLSDGPKSYILEEDTSEIPNSVHATNRGTYRLKDGDTLNIANGRSYIVQVSALGSIVSAETIVPDPIHILILQSSADFNYGGEPIGLKFNKSPGIRGYFVLTKTDYDQPYNLGFDGSSVTFTSDTVFSIPWSSFQTLGDTWIYLYAIDANYFEYYRTHKRGNPTQSLFQSTSTVQGGYGILASASVDSVHVMIR